MKIIFAGFLVSLIGIGTVSSCSKSSIPAPKEYMTASIGSNAFNAQLVVGGVTAASSLEISGNTGSGQNISQQITIFVSNFNDSAGTFPIAINQGTVINAGLTSTIAYGTMIITSASASSATGTFSLTTTDSIKVTNGTFYVAW